ncbi:hypothetical protein, partial [uncultured Muribaculum sp.]|uniref:hypothetical protein n=1 Tax=uncultured Muribaculum sp. TaxID=1918613 RepID=UPI0025DE229F
MPALSVAIPALSVAIPALSVAIPALSIAMPALSVAIPVFYESRCLFLFRNFRKWLGMPKLFPNFASLIPAAVAQLVEHQLPKLRVA